MMEDEEELPYPKSEERKWELKFEEKQVIKELVDAGCYLRGHGSNHDIYANPKNGKKALIPYIQRSRIVFAD
jgi:hypothetical protein